MKLSRAMLGGKAHALLFDGLYHIGVLSREVEVSAYALLASRLVSEFAKGIVVQIISAIIKLPAEAFVGLVKVEAAICQ